MKRTRILIILVLAPGLLVCSVQTVEAGPMGTAFTYQGRLIDNNDVADGLYDFQFKLFDDPNVIIGNQVGGDVNKPDMDVIAAQFTVELDFGSNVFDGDARWLEIGVRPGELSDPNGYTTLTPRQEVTAVPYAMYAVTGGTVSVPLELSGSSSTPIISGTNTGSGHGIYGEATVSGADAVYGSHSGGTWGYIGGSMRGVFGKNTNNANMGWLAGPDEGVRGDSLSGYGVYGSSTNRAIYGLAFNNYGYNGYSGYFENGNFYVGGGYVGIGTATPAYELDVSGSIRATGTIYGNVDNADKVDGYHAGNSSGQVAISNGTLCMDLNADKLDGLDASSFLSVGSDYGRSGVSSTLYEGATALTDKYLGKTATASNSDKVDGYHAGNSSGRVAVSNGTKCTNLNADLLDGQSGSYYRSWNNLTNIPAGFADGVDNVDGGLTLPYSGSTSTNGNAFSVTNSYSGDVTAIYGHASDGGAVTNYGGWFEAAGSSGYGIFGKATGDSGNGVRGFASNTGDVTNYGGWFRATGTQGRGVYGSAINSGNYVNYGGYFEAAGGTFAQGVFGCATNTGSDYANIGGGFLAKGGLGVGVFAQATGSESSGVYAYGEEYDFYAWGPGIDYGSSSSIRWKSDIEPIDEPLEKIMQLRGVYFNWDAEHGGHHDVGMIAEEVGKVLPEIVVYEENGIDATGMDYNKTTPLLVEAVKALKTEVDELQRENADLRSRLDAIEKMMSGSSSRFQIGVQ